MYTCRLNQFYMTVTINKRGNSLGIRIPKHIVDKASLEAGKEFEIILGEKGELILKVKEDELTLEDLLKGVNPDDLHDLLIT